MASDIDWSAYSHAYGRATDVGENLKKLSDPDQWEQALQELYASILHQGTIYPATMPAIPELAEIVLDPSSPGRAGAAEFLADFANSVRWRNVSSQRRLPAARRALADVLPRLVPCLNDPDPAIRQWTAIFLERTEKLPVEALEALKGRAAIEQDTDVATVLISAVEAQGGSTPVTSPKGAPDPLRFAKAASALKRGKTDPDIIRTVADLWNLCAEEFESSKKSNSAILDIVNSLGSGAVPLLNLLAAEEGRALADAVLGYQVLGVISRSGFEPSLEGLLGIASRWDSIPQIDELIENGWISACRKDTLRNAVVYALIELAPGVTPQGRNHFCDTLWTLITTGPRSTWESQFSELSTDIGWRDIRADGVRPLLALGDPRWLDLLAVALEEGGDRTVYYGDFNSWGDVISGVGRMMAPYDLRQYRFNPFSGHPCPDDQIPAFVDLIKHNFPHASTQWLSAIRTLPASSTSVLADDIIELLDQFDEASLVLGMPGLSKKRDNPLLAQCAPLLIAWKADRAVPLLHRLAAYDWGEAPWAEVALAAITGESRIDESVEFHGLPEFSEESFLRMWAMTPTPALVPAALSIVGEEPKSGFFERRAQLYAASIAAGNDCIDQVWPVVLAIIDRAGQLLSEAIRTAVEMSHNDQTRRDELLALLVGITSTPRKNYYREPDFVAPLIAWDALDGLGVPLTPQCAEAGLKLLARLERYASPDTIGAAELACDLITRVVRRDPSQADAIASTIRTQLSFILDSDKRVTDQIAADQAVTTALRQTLDPISKKLEPEHCRL